MQSYKIPYSSLSNQLAKVKADLMHSVEKVIDSGRYILGPEVKEFEKRFAELCGARHALGVANGTCALHLLWRSVGLEEGDEVITAPNSFIASASSIALAGAKPKFVDVGDDGNMDPLALEAAITPKTRGVVPVHLTGRPAKMKEILEIAKKHQLFVVEDAAQAVGAKLDGKTVGSWGDAAAFSLHPLKNLFALGDGGMITIKEDKLWETLSLARNHGLKTRELCEFWSFNCRLDEIQAAMLLVNLEQLPLWTEQRRHLANRYNNALRGVVKVPDEGPGEYHVYQTYVIRSERRDELQRHLQSKGVEALIHYATPIHLQPPALKMGFMKGDFPKTEKMCEEILSLPLYPGLSEENQDEVIREIKGFYGV